MEPYARLKGRLRFTATDSTSNGPTTTAPSLTLTQRSAPDYNQPCNDPT